MGNACAMLFLAHAGQALRAAGPCRGARSLLSLKTLKAARAKVLLKQCLNWKTITLSLVKGGLIASKEVSSRVLERHMRVEVNGVWRCEGAQRQAV